MVEIWFIRHGESLANAGNATPDPGTIPLTIKGHGQALELSLTIPRAPALIIMSPYQRTQETAQPTRDRFPDAPVAVWPVQEFTFLSPSQFVNTTPLERRPHVEAFWKQADPAFIHGPGAESFDQLCGRVTDMIARLSKETKGPILVFAHEQFIKAVRLVVSEPQMTNAERMKIFAAGIAEPIPNCGVIKAETVPGGIRLLPPKSPQKHAVLRP